MRLTRVFAVNLKMKDKHLLEISKNVLEALIQAEAQRVLKQEAKPGVSDAEGRGLGGQWHAGRRLGHRRRYEHNKHDVYSEECFSQSAQPCHPSVCFLVPFATFATVVRDTGWPQALTQGHPPWASQGLEAEGAQARLHF